MTVVMTSEIPEVTRTCSVCSYHYHHSDALSYVACNGRLLMPSAAAVVVVVVAVVAAVAVVVAEELYYCADCCPNYWIAVMWY
jgi:hypothetical protein